jgi:hypothetical protein
VNDSRFSDEKQGSIIEQEGINAELAEQHGHPLVARFSDAGVSRSIQERPGLMEMFDFISAHREVGFIIVNELERLTAGIAQRAEVVEVCQRLNVWLLTEDMDPIDPFDDDAMHGADQRAAAAKGEVLKISSPDPAQPAAEGHQRHGCDASGLWGADETVGGRGCRVAVGPTDGGCQWAGDAVGCAGAPPR